MSGGVDSSVAAALLKERGFEVIGITMQIWERSRDWGGCCGLSDIEDARRVARILEIPHYVINFRNIFKEKIIDNFCREYGEGRTPNPCIRCNQHLKFGALLGKAKELSADYIATGHYARIEYDKGRKRYLLKKGVDSRKDQSYFLYMMTQEQLKRTLMPLGNLRKDRVRKIAQEKNLPVAKKPESQEICFIPDNDYGEFLKQQVPEEIRPGPFLDKQGRVIGEHRGIIFYTVGQRRGIGITARKPLHVIAIDRESNSITVGRKEEAYSEQLIANDLNFIDREEVKKPLRAEVKVRSLQQASPATVTALDKRKLRIKFDRPQWAITSGQAVVLYSSLEKSAGKNGVVVGGGTIISARR